MWQFADAVRRNREVILMFLLWDSKHFHVFECIMGEGMSVRPYVNIQDHSADFFMEFGIMNSRLNYRENLMSWIIITFNLNETQI